MCAIIGFNFPDRNLIFRMKEFVSNRGPDAEGLYIDENITIKGIIEVYKRLLQ